MAETSFAWSGVPSTLRGDEAHDLARALGVAEDDDAATLVLVGEIVGPGVIDIVVGVGRRAARRHGAGAGHAGAQGAERELAVHRREEAALAAEAGELRLHDVELFRSRHEVGLGEGIERDGRVNVEAVDRRVGVGRELLGAWSSRRPSRWWRRGSRRRRCWQCPACTASWRRRNSPCAEKRQQWPGVLSPRLVLGRAGSELAASGLRRGWERPGSAVRGPDNHRPTNSLIPEARRPLWRRRGLRPGLNVSVSCVSPGIVLGHTDPSGESLSSAGEGQAGVNEADFALYGSRR